MTRRQTILTILLILLPTLILPSLAVPAKAQQYYASTGRYPYGGILKVGTATDLDSLNPAQAFNNPGSITRDLIYDEEMIYDQNKTPIPWMYQSWNTSEGGKTWTVKLYPNETWQDGVPVTSADVKFSYELSRTWNLSYGMAYSPFWQSIDTPDNLTVNFHFSSPVPLPFSHNQIIPKHIWENVTNPSKWTDDNPIGMGPYKFKEWVKGDHWTLVANDNYYRGRPYIDEIIFKYYATVDTMLLALKVGEIDAVFSDSLPVASVPNLLTSDNIHVAISESAKTIGLDVNVLSGATPLQDQRVRQALAYLVDRNSIVDVLLAGYGTPAYSFMAPNSMWTYENFSPLYTFDLNKSAQLLDAAGYTLRDKDGIRMSKNGTRLDMDIYTYAEEPTYIRAAEMISESAASVGWKLTVTPLDEGALWAIQYPPLPQSTITVDYWTTLPPDFSYMGQIFLKNQISASGYNCFNWWDPAYEAAWHGWNTELNPTNRMEDGIAMQTLVYDQAVFIGLYHPKTIQAYRTDKFAGFVNLPGGVLMYDNMYTFLNVHPLQGRETPATQAPTTQAPAPSWTGAYVTTAVVLIIAVIGISVYVSRRRKQKATKS